MDLSRQSRGFAMPACRVTLIAVALILAPAAMGQSTSGTASGAAIETLPIRAGVTLVLAVSNAPGQGPSEVPNMLQGDYEVVVELGPVDREGVTLTAYMEGVDASGIHHRGSIPRFVPRGDLAAAREQVIGFFTGDPRRLDGTTTLGPSLAMLQELRVQGRTEYVFRNSTQQPRVSGTLAVTSPSRVRFPVLINGRRTEVDALRARGQLTSNGATRPFETWLLDHPEQPVSLRIAWGKRGATHPFEPEFQREVVRIDWAEPSIAESLQRQCRVELDGLYFDFNRATLKPESDPALRRIAQAIARSPQRALRLEGHTDSIGDEQYNDQLSRRRAGAVEAALVRDYQVPADVLSTTGYGERKPVEPNDTLAGRARNRRVELVCADR